MGFFDTTVGEVASPIASLITGAANVYMQNQNNKLTRELAQQQNQWNIEQWNRENEYNLPSNQMQRFVDAGLNPNLIYGKDSVAATSPQMVSGYDSQVAPKMQFDPSTLLMASQARVNNARAELMEDDLKSNESQREYLAELCDNLHQETENLKAYFNSIEKDNLHKDLQNFYDWRTLNYRISKTSVDLDFSKKQRDAYDRIATATALMYYGSAAYNFEKSVTERELRDLKQHLMEGEAEAAFANAAYLFEQGSYQHMYNANYKEFGEGLMVSDIIDKTIGLVNESTFNSSGWNLGADVGLRGQGSKSAGSLGSSALGNLGINGGSHEASRRSGSRYVNKLDNASVSPKVDQAYWNALNKIFKRRANERRFGKPTR